MTSSTWSTWSMSLTGKISETLLKAKATQKKRRSKSTAQPQDVEEVPIDGWTSGLNMPIEGDSLSIEDLGMDLSIIDGYPEEQQTQGLSSQTNDWSGPDEDNSRPPTADSRSPTADRRFPNREENQSDYTFDRWMTDLFGAANLI